MKHIFVIKDLFATPESAKRIIESQINVILKSAADIDISKIQVFYNEADLEEYHVDVAGDIPVVFTPVLKVGKKKMKKLSFASLHNFAINSISSAFSKKDKVVHIMDGTLDITDFKAEHSECKTRVGEMIVDVLDMMKLLEYPVWFNTATDKGNIKFGHYYTNIDLINIDSTFGLESFPECIMYSGNTNLDWIIIDCEKYDKKTMPSLLLNSQYEYDFLSIKEFIGKFANYEHGYFTTMFPTVPTEVGAYYRNDSFDRDLQKYDMTNYKENLAKYKLNLSEYKNLKPATIVSVINYVKSMLVDKLTDNDKAKLKKYADLIK